MHVALANLPFGSLSTLAVMLVPAAVSAAAVNTTTETGLDNLHLDDLRWLWLIMCFGVCTLLQIWSDLETNLYIFSWAVYAVSLALVLIEYFIYKAPFAAYALMMVLSLPISLTSFALGLSSMFSGPSPFPSRM